LEAPCEFTFSEKGIGLLPHLPSYIKLRRIDCASVDCNRTGIAGRSSIAVIRVFEIVWRYARLPFFKMPNLKQTPNPLSSGLFL
jgi:hypothetical protein